MQKVILLLKGIDVSYANGIVDWETVKPQIDFAIIRIGYSKTVDKQFERNIRECERLSVPYGIYLFSYATSVKDALEEAIFVESKLKGHKPLLPIYWDYEYDSDRYAKDKKVSITNNLRSCMATAFCSYLEHCGYYAGIYANKDYVETKFNKEIFDKHDLWYAQYSSTKAKDCYLWQNSSKGKIKGIDGNVDTNIAYLDFPNIIKKRKLNGW